MQFKHRRHLWHLARIWFHVVTRPYVTFARRHEAMKKTFRLALLGLVHSFWRLVRHVHKNNGTLKVFICGFQSMHLLNGLLTLQNILVGGCRGKMRKLEESFHVISIKSVSRNVKVICQSRFADFSCSNVQRDKSICCLLLYIRFNIYFLATAGSTASWRQNPWTTARTGLYGSVFTFEGQVVVSLIRNVYVLMKVLFLRLMVRQKKQSDVEPNAYGSRRSDVSVSETRWRSNNATFVSFRDKTH